MQFLIAILLTIGLIMLYIPKKPKKFGFLLIFIASAI